jgi:hypothetical protein
MAFLPDLSPPQMTGSFAVGRATMDRFAWQLAEIARPATKAIRQEI